MQSEREYCEAAERDPDAWELFRERPKFEERRCPNPMYTPEFCCRIIEPGVKLEAVSANATKPYGYLLTIPDSSGASVICMAITAATAQEAWREAFKFLDRRKANTRGTSKKP